MDHYCTKRGVWVRDHSPTHRGRYRPRWSCVPRLSWLESRLLLSGIPADPVMLTSGSTLPGMMAAGGARFYTITSDGGGKLTVTITAAGFPARVSLVDAQGNPLIESDGPAIGGSGDTIDVNVAAGTNYLEVQSLGGKGPYQITADLIATDAPFQPIPSMYNNANQLAEGDFNGDHIPDLVAPEGIHLGTGDGTFLSQVASGPLGTSGWMVTAVAVVNGNGDSLPEVAFTQVSPDYNCAQLCVLQDIGNAQLQPVVSLPFEPGIADPYPTVIQTIDFGDGRAGLAIADQYSGNVVIFTGNGQGSFTQTQTLSGLDVPVAVVSGEFGDGHVDLMVADNGDPSGGDNGGLVVYQASATDEFQQSGTIAAGSGPLAIVTGNFTGSGLLDLAVADEYTGDVSVLLNDGNGTFPNLVSYPVGSVPEAIVAGDFGNGHVDLAIANNNSNDVSILMGNGDGTFQSQLRFAAGAGPASLIAYDLNGDGRVDLAVGDQGPDDDGPGAITVLLGLGTGTFQDQVSNPVGDAPEGTATADLNDDGHLDVITSNRYTNDVTVLMGNGDGTFQTPMSFAAGVEPDAIVVGDFNGDGLLDLAVADAGLQGSGAGVSILMGNGNGTFQSPIPYSFGEDPSSIVTGHFTASGALDLAVADQGGNTISILLGDGKGGFVVESTIKLVGNAGGPAFLIAADLGNGETDLAVANYATDNVSVLMGDGQGHFTVSPPIALGNDTQEHPSAIVAGKFSGGNAIDLAITITNTNGPDFVTILDATGEGQFAAGATIPLGTDAAPSSITTGYYFGVSSLDLAIAESGADQVVLLQGDGAGGFNLPTAISIATQGAPITVTTGDFTGNGKSDLAIAFQGPDSVAIELYQSSGIFAAPNLVGLVPRNTPVVADFTGDGVPDVAIVDGSGDILFRQGVANQPGNFDAPKTINNDFPSRDIAAVNTSQGVVLASADVNDNDVSFYSYSDGILAHENGELPTGNEPAQIVAADLSGSKYDDLIIRNAGSGTLTIYLVNPGGTGYVPAITLSVGSGVSDVSVGDVNQDRRQDILLANQTSGEVEVILNLGDGTFSQPLLYRAGVGLSAVVGGAGTTPQSVYSQDGTIGVAAIGLTPDGPPDIVALDAGANTFGMLVGLGGGRFANPSSEPTTGTTIAVRVADLEHNGESDMAILGPNGITLWWNDRLGSLVQGATYNVGPDPTGLTIVDLGGDNGPDLIVGDAFGDVLVLVNQGGGLFQPPTPTADSVDLAVTHPNGSVAPSFVFSDQGNDSVVVKSSASGNLTLGSRATGLLVPGRPVLAYLNGDTEPEDLIVVNSGGNDVFVYPGEPSGALGPALNDGQGFAVGTDPVAVIVANLDGRQDLIVANKGSNDVSILLNKAVGNSFTFVQGPRIRVGEGPDSLLYGNFYANGGEKLAVADSGSHDLMVIPSIGGGFFDVPGATIVPLSESPGQIVPGFFESGTGMDIVALNPDSGDVTLIFGLSIGMPQSQIFSSGGLGPIAAVVAHDPDGLDDLVVANNADGRLALLQGGPDGLTVGQVITSPELVNPTDIFSLASAFQNNSLEIYASTAGDEAAILLGFSLGTLGGVSAGVQALTLAPLSDMSLPLIATLLTPLVDLNATAELPASSPEASVEVVALATSAPLSLGQGPFSRADDDWQIGDDGEFTVDPDEPAPAASEKNSLSPWKRIEIGLDEAFEEFRRATKSNPQSNDGRRGEVVPPTEGDPSRARSGSATSSQELKDASLVGAAIASVAPGETPAACYRRSHAKSWRDAEISARTWSV